ncbi:MAG: hypothetical protein KDA93_07050 [Planctomycetaceae bacterium]|nr:hypothetical protein [Planctomycetaceae bacterium]
MRCLGIDIGSTSIKGAVLDLEQRSVGTPVSSPFPAPIASLPEGWVEIEPQAVCKSVDEVIATLMEQAPYADRLLFSGQMGGLILIDDRAQPLTNYISWRDQRTLAGGDSDEPSFDEVRSRWEEAAYFETLGHELQAGSTTTLLHWLHKQERLPSHAMPVTIADFVIAKLVGHPITMHATHAIGMLDLSRDVWHREALECIGLQHLRLPELAFDERAVGTASVVGREFVVHGSYGDQQCALRGAGLKRGELSLNISTGSQVSRRTAAFQPGDYQSRKFFGGDYLDTITHLPAGRSLNVLVDLLTELARAEGVSLNDPWKSIQSKVAEVEETNLEVDLAFFNGPLGDRGSIMGITTENLNVGHLFHASFRAMADNAFLVSHRFGPADWTAVVLSGGITQSSPLLRTLIEQRFSLPIRESAGEETLLGLLEIARSTLN